MLLRRACTRTRVEVVKEVADRNGFMSSTRWQELPQVGTRARCRTHDRNFETFTRRKSSREVRTRPARSSASIVGPSIHRRQVLA